MPRRRHAGFKRVMVCGQSPPPPVLSTPSGYPKTTSSSTTSSTTTTTTKTTTLTSLHSRGVAGPPSSQGPASGRRSRRLTLHIRDCISGPPPGYSDLVFPGNLQSPNCSLAPRFHLFRIAFGSWSTQPCQPPRQTPDWHSNSPAYSRLHQRLEIFLSSCQLSDSPTLPQPRTEWPSGRPAIASAVPVTVFVVQYESIKSSFSIAARLVISARRQFRDCISVTLSRS